MSAPDAAVQIAKGSRPVTPIDLVIVAAPVLVLTLLWHADTVCAGLQGIWAALLSVCRCSARKDG